MKTAPILLLFLIASLTLSCSSSSDEISEPDNNHETPLTDKIGETLTIPTEHNLYSVKFATESVGYIAGGIADIFEDNNRATILKTTDAGKTWTSVFSDSGYFTTSVYAISATEVYVSTNKNFILKTNNGGATWEQVQVSANDFFMSHINFKNQTVGYIAGSVNANGKLYKTEDGGTTWIDVAANNTELTDLLTDNQLTKIAFQEDNSLVISGGLWNKATLIKSTDAGATWQKVTITDSMKATGLAVQGTNGFLVGHNGVVNAGAEHGALYKTTNHGDSWSLVNTGYKNRMLNVAFKNETICVVGRNESNDLVNPEFIILSEDNGATWKRVQHDFVVGGWYDVTFISENRILVIGMNGKAITVTL